MQTFCGPAGVQVRYTDASDGDFSPLAAGVAARRRGLYPGPWAWNRQVHGARVRFVENPAPGDEDNGSPADALITTSDGVVLSVITADCAPVILWTLTGDMVAVAHAGWRGLAEGIVDRTVEHMRAAGAGPIAGQLGPCIHPCCYEFGSELDALERTFGPSVRALSGSARPAFDLPAAIEITLDRRGVSLDRSATECTGCAPTPYFSHRVRRDVARLASVVWIDR